MCSALQYNSFCIDIYFVSSKIKLKSSLGLCLDCGITLSLHCNSLFSSSCCHTWSSLNCCICMFCNFVKFSFPFAVMGDLHTMVGVLKIKLLIFILIPATQFSLETAATFTLTSKVWKVWELTCCCSAHIFSLNLGIKDEPASQNEKAWSISAKIM